MSEWTQVYGQGQPTTLRELLQAPAIRHQIGLPPQHALHQVSLLEFGVLRLFDDSHCNAPHYLTQGHRGHVAGILGHPTAVGRIKRQVNDANEHLPRGERRKLLFLKQKI
jgi:hypothetical protein